MDSCATCGSPVKIEGKETKYYVPAYQQEIDTLKQQLQERDALIEEFKGQLMNAVNHLNRANRHARRNEYEQAITSANRTLSKTPPQALEEHNARLREEVARECLELIETTWEQMDEKIRDREFNDTIANDTVWTCFVWMKRAIRNKHLTESEEG